MSALPTYIVGALLAFGGAMGYAKKKSTISLVMGLASGAILFYAASIMPHPFGYDLSIGFSALLGLVMGFRFFKSKKFMPAGVVATSTLLLAAYNYLNYH